MSMACTISLDIAIIGMISKGGKNHERIPQPNPMTTATDNELLEKFRQLSTQTRIPASRLLDEAIEDLLVKYAVMTKEEKKNP